MLPAGLAQAAGMLYKCSGSLPDLAPCAVEAIFHPQHLPFFLMLPADLAQAAGLLYNFSGRLTCLAPGAFYTEHVLSTLPFRPSCCLQA